MQAQVPLRAAPPNLLPGKNLRGRIVQPHGERLQRLASVGKASLRAFGDTPCHRLQTAPTGRHLLHEADMEAIGRPIQRILTV